MRVESRGNGSPRRSCPTRKWTPMISRACGKKVVGSIHISWAKIGAAFRTTAAMDSRLRLRDRSEFNGSVMMIVLMKILGRDRGFYDPRSLVTNRYFGGYRTRPERTICFFDFPARILQGGAHAGTVPVRWRASYGTGMSGTVGTLT